MEAFTLSPLRVAPEREAELLALLDEHGVGVHLKLNAEDLAAEYWRLHVQTNPYFKIDVSYYS
jgi:hypothetical protein